MENMDNVQNFDEGTVVHLNQEAANQEHIDSAELMKTLTDRYNELEAKIVAGNLTDEEILTIQTEMNEIEEERAQLESTTPSLAA